MFYDLHDLEVIQIEDTQAFTKSFPSSTFLDLDKYNYIRREKTYKTHVVSEQGRERLSFTGAWN